MGWKEKVKEWISASCSVVMGEVERLDKSECDARRKIREEIKELDKRWARSSALNGRRGDHIEANEKTLGEFRKRIEALEEQAQRDRYEALPEFVREQECPLCESPVFDYKQSGHFEAVDWECNGMPIVTHTCKCGWSIVTKAKCEE